MLLRLGRRAIRATVFPVTRLILATVCAGTLAACTHDGKPNVANLQPRGATVAFESIDGLPPGHFERLVRNLNDEAQSRRLAVISRDDASAYRVRGYLAAQVMKGRPTISWVWDVFDRDQRRVLRIDGEETAKETVKSARDAWNVADDAMLHRIAQSSMDRLAAFLTSPEIAPGATTQIAYVPPDDRSPEAAGIFRIFQPKADPLPADTAGLSGTQAGAADPVPLPPRRPDAAATVSALDSAGPSRL